MRMGVKVKLGANLMINDQDMRQEGGSLSEVTVILPWMAVWHEKKNAIAFHNPSEKKKLIKV